MSTFGDLVSLRERNKEDKLQRIREAAWALFLDQGFRRTTTREVCERAGIGAGTLFSYVDDKGDLLVLLWAERFAAIMEARFAALPDGGLAERLVWVFDGFLAFYDEHRELGKEILPELMVLSGRKAERMLHLQWQFTMRGAALIEAARAGGEVRRDAPAEVAFQTVFGAYVVVLAALLNGFVPDREAALELLRAQVDVVISGIGPKEER